MQIIQEAIGSVDPGHDGHLYTAQYEGAVGGAVVVEDLEDVDAAIGDHGETHQEHEAADAERHPLPVVPPEVGELVQQDGDDGLRGGELRPEAEEEKHQEEETTPERRERHLQYSLWVGDKSQARTWRIVLSKYSLTARSFSYLQSPRLSPACQAHEP